MCIRDSLNADGQSDIFATASDSIHIWENIDSTFEPLRINLEASGEYTYAELHDFNNDGCLDAYLSGADSGNTILHGIGAANGSSTCSSRSNVSGSITPAISSPESYDVSEENDERPDGLVSIGDVNEDNFIDEVIVSYENGKTLLQVNLWNRDALNGRGQFQSTCLLYTSPSPRDATLSRMPSSA